MRSGTEYQSRGRWYDTQLVRWYDGVALGPVGGWIVKSTSAVTGSPRAMIAWKANDGTRRAGIGTHSKLYAMSSTGALADITPVGFTSGDADATVKRGYGTGLYGKYAYGTPRPDTGNFAPATVWDLDIWGQYLVCCSHADGTLYEYQNTGVAAAITNAPTSCHGLVVHPKRLLIALGAGGNPRKFQWSDLGNNTVWAPSPTNQAGSNEIPQGKLITARAVGDQVIMLTDVDAHVVDYLGLPFVLRARKVGDACGALAKGCIVSAGSFAAWWSKSGFWVYDGVVRPLRCDLWDDLQRSLTTAQQSKVTGFHNSKNQEIWWFYPRDGASEITDYVFWSYRYDHWANGTLSRLAGCQPGIFESPFCISSTGYVYEHELGFQYGGSTPSARGGPFELGEGGNVMHVLGIVPDERTSGDVSVSFRTRFYPSASETVLGSTTLNSAGKTDLRFSARQVELVVNGARATDWRWGQPRLNLAQGGKR
jgi:hypothetical protein